MKKMKLDIQLFNGSVAIQTITETTDDSLNQSTFTIPAKMTTTGATYNNSNANMTLQWKYASASSWTSLSKQTFKIGKNSSVTKSWTLTLDHEPDGTLANVQFRVSWYITDSTKGTTGATTFEPTTIPRASQPTLNYSSREFGQSVVITTNRYSSSFTHTLNYTFNGTSGTIATNVGASYTWSIPNSMMNSITTATQGQCIINCKTYNGTTLVGSTYVSLILVVPTSVVPTISNVTQQEVGDVPSSWNTLVQGKSRLKFTITASGAYSSTISSYTITGDGYTYTTNPATTNYIRSSGSMVFNFKVVDSRGRIATASLTRAPQPYSNPTISTAQVQRCDANGNIDNNGEYMYISYGASISSCNGYNTPSAVYKVGYRVHNTGNYTYVNLTTNANSYSASGMLFTDGIKAASSTGTKVQFSTNNTYDIQFYVKDYFMEYTNVQSLDAGFDLMNFNASGKAMAIGKVSEAGANEELLEIGLRTKFYEPIKDELVVDSIRSKNILNTFSFIKGRLNQNSGQIERESGTTSLSTTKNSITFTTNTAWNNGATSDFIPVVVGNYTYSGTSNIKIAFFVDTYDSSKTWVARMFNDTQTGAKTRTFTIGSGVAYIRFHYEGPTSDTYTITNPQIEKGSTATTFYPYQDLDNQEIYSTGEIKIGTWIDGKPLYRKVVIWSPNYYINKDTIISLTHGISNLNEVCICNAIANWNNKFMPLTTHYQNQANEIAINTIDSSNINFTSYGENWGATKITFILEYTKTTD